MSVSGKASSSSEPVSHQMSSLTDSFPEAIQLFQLFRRQDLPEFLPFEERVSEPVRAKLGHLIVEFQYLLLVSFRILHQLSHFELRLPHALEVRFLLFS